MKNIYKLDDFINERNSWTKEKLQEEANKYKTRGEFWLKSASAANSAKKQNIIDELFKNHKNSGFSENKNINDYWTKDKLQEEANKYETRGDFSIKNKTAFIYSNRKGLLDELFKNHPNNGYSENRVIKGYWYKEKAKEEADKYKTRSELLKNNISLYSFLIKNKLIDEIFKNHINNGLSDRQVKHGYWKEEKLQEEANKYKTRGDLNKYSRNAYKAAIRLNILDELFKNHKNNGYSDKKEWSENSYVIYVYELPGFNKAYVGLTNNIIRRDREHIFDVKEAINKFCVENNIPLPKFKILEENLKSGNAQKQEKYWINIYKENNWEMFNIAKAGSLGGIVKKWTKTKLQEEANKYKTRNDFAKNSNSAYLAASVKGIIDELFNKHENNGYNKNRKYKNYWTKESLQEEANKYNTRYEFQLKNSSAYHAAIRISNIDDLFKNHPNNGYKQNKIK